MKKIAEEKVGELTGSLYLEKLGYTYKIRARLKTTGRIGVVARSCVYIAYKEKALEMMRSDLKQLSGQRRLF